MKKLFVSLIVTLGLVAFLPVTAMAQAVPGTTLVDGQVTLSNNTTPVIGASVTVRCNDTTLTATSTTPDGYYYTTFTSDQCPIGATAYVSASQGGLSGSNNGPVDTIPTVINLAVVDVSLVPEFGAFTGVAAIALGAGAFLVIRRHNIAGNKN